MEAVVDPGQVILDEVAQTRARIASDEALLAGKLLEFEDVRVGQAAHLVNLNDRALAEAAIRDELSLTLVQPVGTVYHRLSQMRIVRDRLPKTWAAFVVGKVDAYRVGLIGAAANKLSDDDMSFIELDYRLADYAATHTGSQLRAKLKRFIARIEPDQAASRARAEHDRRGVWVQHGDDGMSYLNAYLSTVDAVRIMGTTTTRAKNTPADGRTFDAICADVFVDQLLTTADGSRAGGAVIGLTIAVTTLAGLDEQPGVSFDGDFVLPADLVRDLALEPGTLFYRIITDPLGKILDITEIGRFPSPKLRIGIQIRDGSCRFPTCSRPAEACDLDHKIPNPRGPTSGDNLAPLCRRHHNMKTTGILNPYTATIRDAAA
jgi:hypothetical protein